MARPSVLTRENARCRVSTLNDDLMKLLHIIVNLKICLFFSNSQRPFCDDQQDDGYQPVQKCFYDGELIFYISEQLCIHREVLEYHIRSAMEQHGGNDASF